MLTDQQINQIDTPEMRLRAHWANALFFALDHCHREDAAQIMVAELDKISAGMPCFDLWGDIRADAEFWADCAHPAELEVYFAASLKRLGSRALGLLSRKRLFIELWRSFPSKDRQVFLSRVDAQGQFVGGRA